MAYYYALNDAQVILVQNYLAAKFNVTLSSNDTYRGDNAGLNFDYDVAGIGRVDGSNIHSDAQGTGWVRIFNPSDLGDNEFLTWGHNNASIATVNTSDVPSGIDARLNRVWRVSEANASGATAVNVGNVSLQIDLSALSPPITASDLRLLIDHDGDGIFNEAGTISIGSAIDQGCNLYLFSGIPDASITDGDRFTIATINSAQTPLPVTLASFTGTIRDGDAHLSWETVSEQENDYFDLQRSLNGIHFFPIARIDGAGTSVARLHYEYVDAFAPYGRLYYRLRQTDFDGTSTYSKVITLTNEAKALELLALPNPSTPGEGILLRVTSDERLDASTCTIDVRDMTGRKVHASTTPAEQGDILLTFNASQPAGLYIVTLRSPQFAVSLSSRIVLVR